MDRIIKFLICFAALAAVSCTNYKDIRVGGFRMEKVRVEGLSDIVVTCSALVDNPAPSDITVDKFDAELLKDGKVFAVVEMIESGVAKARSESRVDVTCNVSITDPISMLAMGLDPDDWDMDMFYVNATIVVASGNGFRKTIRFKEKQFSKVANALAVIKK